MKKYPLYILFFFLYIAVSPLLAQNKLAIDDRALLLTADAESFLKTRFESENIELTSTVDLKNRCDYWFAMISAKDDEYILTVKDCNERIAGTKNLGTKIKTANDSEKSLLIYYALSEILSEPFREIPEVKVPVAVPDTSSSQQQVKTSRSAAGEHKSRYFFAPSSYNLQKGELYYNSLYFFLHDVQYGISDKFSLGMGTTIMGFPFYLTPKITIPYNDKSTFAFGDLLLLGTWNTDFFGNLLYLTYTRGGYENNFTVGTGILYTNDGKATNTTTAPIINFSGLGKVSDHIFFITENYASSISSKQDASYSNYVTSEYYSEVFDQNIFFIYGLTGFRFINRTKDVISWQLGLTYLYRSFGPIPLRYKGANWYTSTREDAKFITFPVVGFTRKFGVKY